MKKIALSLCMVLLTGLLAGTAMPLYAQENNSSAAAEDFLSSVSSDETIDSSVSASSTSEPLPESSVDEGVDRAQLQESLQPLIDKREILALVYLSDTYVVRSAADEKSDPVVTVPSGQQVTIIGVASSESGTIWANVSFEYNGITYEGFINRRNLACSDERFLSWEETNLPVRAARFSAASNYADIAQFPEDYQAALTSLKQAHPNWTFVKMNTNLDWNTVVKEEMTPRSRSLVPNSFSDQFKDGMYGTQGWSYASEYAVTYYLDPRNWLTEDYIFQFELLTYNESYHTEAAVQSFLNNTFMAGIVPMDERTYARVFWDIGKELGVSPFHLANRVYHEQGVNGSTMISGTYPGYEGLYNHYNIGAAGSTTTAVLTSGLQKAREKGWTTPYLSIRGGADLISANYIRQGQDTVYLQKFDVEPTNGMYWHQYMQSVFAPSSEGKQIRNLYASAGSLDNTFVFKIPVYNNMPGAPKEPTTHIIITPPAGYTGTTMYIDGSPYTGLESNGHLIIDQENTISTNVVMYKYNDAGIPIGMYVWMVNYQNGEYVVTPVGELEDLLTYHGFSVRVTGNSGIRFKTGIDIAKRNSLTSTGLAGYTLKEYGTLAMRESNRTYYPMVLGGEKVSSGIAYGINSSGTAVDNIYESVNNRYRFTSVLVGLPSEQYGTDFAFRGYAILTKDGRDVTIYGPPVSRSLYTLSNQVLEDGDFEEGSDAYNFLKNIIDTVDIPKVKEFTESESSSSESTSSSNAE